MARRSFSVKPTSVSAATDAGSEVAQILTELGLMGYDTSSREGILEGLQSGMGYFAEDAEVLVEKIAEVQGLPNNTDVSPESAMTDDEWEDGYVESSEELVDGKYSADMLNICCNAYTDGMQSVVDEAILSYLQSLGADESFSSVNTNDTTIRYTIDSIDRVDDLADYIYEYVSDPMLLVQVIDDNTLEISNAQDRESSDVELSTDIEAGEDVEQYEDEIQEIGQEFTSENTSINSGKLPAVFNMVQFNPGTVNIDYGGGRFDNVAEYLKQYDVINLVYDPYNRSKEHNQEVIRLVREHGGADTATCSNVLNVIKEEEVRLNVLNNIKKLVKASGTVYITVYEGSGKGEGAPTKSGYQMNRKTADYLDEIKQVFPDATRKGKLIVCHPHGGSVESSTSVEGARNSKSLTKESLEAELRAAAEDFFTNKYMIDINEMEEIVVDIHDGKYYGGEPAVIVEIRTELGYDSLTELAYALDPIVEKYDDNSYFEPDVGCILNAYMDPSCFAVSASTDIIEGETLPGPGDYDPPEYDDPSVYDDSSETKELTLDAIINIDKDGSWTYEDESYSWARQDEKQADLYSDEYPQLMLSMHSSTVEYVDSLLETRLPMEKGRYRISGDVELVFDISGVEYDRQGYDLDDYEDEIYTDSAQATFNYSASDIKNFKCRKVAKEKHSGEVNVENSTQITSASSDRIELNGGYFARLDGRPGHEGDIQISKNRPYDDADYWWAFYDASDDIWKLVKSNRVQRKVEPLADPWEDAHRIGDQVAALNSVIEEKIIHI